MQPHPLRAQKLNRSLSTASRMMRALPQEPRACALMTRVNSSHQRAVRAGTALDQHGTQHRIRRQRRAGSGGSDLHRLNCDLHRGPSPRGAQVCSGSSPPACRASLLRPSHSCPGESGPYNCILRHVLGQSASCKVVYGVSCLRSEASSVHAAAVSNSLPLPPANCATAFYTEMLAGRARPQCRRDDVRVLTCVCLLADSCLREAAPHLHGTS